MCIYIYIYVCICIYIYIYISISLSLYIYIYIYIYEVMVRPAPARAAPAPVPSQAVDPMAGTHTYTYYICWIYIYYIYIYIYIRIYCIYIYIYIYTYISRQARSWSRLPPARLRRSLGMHLFFKCTCFSVLFRYIIIVTLFDFSKNMVDRLEYIILNISDSSYSFLCARAKRDFLGPRANGSAMVAIFCPLGLFSEIVSSLLSLQTQPRRALNLFQTEVKYGK